MHGYPETIAFRHSTSHTFRHPKSHPSDNRAPSPFALLAVVTVSLLVAALALAFASL